MNVLKIAIEEAKKNHILTVVVASTTGATAARLFEFVKGEKLRMIVITHDEGIAPRERRFNEDIRRRLLADNITVYTHHPRNILLRKITGRILETLRLPSWYKHLKGIREKHGTGIKVCHIIVRMLMEGGILREGKIVAVAGRKNGADSAAVFVVSPKNKWPIMEEIITSACS